MTRWRRLSFSLALCGLLLIVAGCPEPPAGECDADAQCDDGDECTRDVCDAGSCVNNPDDTLVPGQISPIDCRQEICQGGRKVSVSNDNETPTDNVPCTIDRCVGGSIQSLPDDNQCGAPGDCRAFACDPDGALGTPNLDGCTSIVDNNNLPNDDADCTADTCVNGTPIFTPNNAVCSFVGGGGCALAVCDPNNQTTNDGSGCALLLDNDACDDGNFCTDDACDPTAAGANGEGCVLAPVAGNPDPIPGNCNQEVCQNGVPTQVPDVTDVPVGDIDGIACTEAACDASGQVIESPKDTLCDDGLACTDDFCDPVVGCAAAPNALLCNPGEACDPTEDPALNPSGCVNSDTCPGTIPAIPGQNVSDDTSARLDDFAPSCADNTGAHPDLAFSLVLTEDSDVVLLASPTQGQALSVIVVPVSGGACGGELLCAAAAPGQSAEISVVNLAAGEYALVIDGNGAAQQSGTFDLGVLVAPTALAAGDLVISEMQANPRTLADGNAEFLEIFNPSNTTSVGTTGLALVEDDGSPAEQTLLDAAGGQLIVPPGGFLLGVPSADPVANGGLVPDFDLLHSLNNTPNENFIIRKGALVVDQVNLPAGGFPTATDGASVQLDSAKLNATLNDAFANWCVTPTNVYTATGPNRGTPGALNESCTPALCTVATQATDCNDNNACTDDLCVSGACQNQAINGTPNDGFSCTVDTCVNGVPTFTPDDAQCDDGVLCTLDVCQGTGGAAGTGCVALPDNSVCGPNESCDPINDCQAGAPVCGNGIVESGESCDDNNTIDGDGCSALCQLENVSLFFSEYVEGSGNNKAVEILNPFPTAFDLAANTCSVRVFTNGAGAPSATVNLTGTVASGDVFVLCNPGINGAILGQCDATSGSLNVNGDDALQLFCGGQVLDVIGQIGFDPGVEWTAGGDLSTQDNTLRRKCGVTSGDTNGANDFNADLPLTWVGFVIDTLAGLGDPTCAP